jgi:hemolysin III
MPSRKRKKTPPRQNPHTFSKKAISSTAKPQNNPILEYYYASCQRHSVDANASASIAFSTSTTYILARKVDFDLSHLLPICETLASFKDTTSVEHLSFKHCKLGSMCVPALAACLKENTTVTTLDLPGNLISDDVADAVADIILTAKSLVTLNIDANGLTKHACRTLASAVVKNGGNMTNLKRIVFTNNYLQQHGVDLMTQAGANSDIDIVVEAGNFIVEETWNAITHGLASAASITMLVLLCRQAVHCNASTRTWWAVMLYSISQLIMFLCSTLYHSFSCCVAPNVIYIFGVLDHTAIYLLIAGTYTPYLSVLHNNGDIYLSIASMVAVWSLAAIGIGLDVMFEADNKLAKRAGLVIYLVQGWFVLFVSPWLFPLMTDYSLKLLGLGGLAYTGGVYFYILGEVQVSYHVIWHMFVFLGALLHYFSVQDTLFGSEGGIHPVCDWS